jgi:hypothetical protein
VVRSYSKDKTWLAAFPLMWLKRMQGHKQGNHRCGGERIDKNRVIDYIGARMLLTRLFVDNLLAVVVFGGGGREEVKTRRIPASVPTFFFPGERATAISSKVSDSKRIRWYRDCVWKRWCQDKVNCMTYLPVPSASGRR